MHHFRQFNSVICNIYMDCDNFLSEVTFTLCDAIFYLQQSQKFSLVFISISGTGIVLAMFALWYLSLAVEEIRYVRSLSCRESVITRDYTDDE